jgi:hypothetical protein
MISIVPRSLGCGNYCLASSAVCYLHVEVRSKVAQYDVESGDWAMARGLGERLGLSYFHGAWSTRRGARDSWISVDLGYIFIVERLSRREEKE